MFLQSFSTLQSVVLCSTKKLVFVVNEKSQVLAFKAAAVSNAELRAIGF